MSLIAFVYFCACIFECRPYFFANLFCYGTNFTPFVMKVLQTAERGNNIRLFDELGSLVDKQLLFTKVFLEIIVA